LLAGDVIKLAHKSHLRACYHNILYRAYRPVGIRIGDAIYPSIAQYSDTFHVYGFFVTVMLYMSQPNASDVFQTVELFTWVQ
jgi:hypothetical protein